MPAGNTISFSSRIVVSVDGGRRHIPFGAVDRLADLGEVAAKLEIAAPLYVFDIRAAYHLVGRIVAPFIGISDFESHGGELREGLPAGGLAHPGEGLKVGAQRLHDVEHHGASAHLGVGREGLRDVFLPKRFTEIAVGGDDAALPAGLQFLGAGERATVVVKILIDKFLRKLRGCGMNDVPAQVHLPISQRHRGQAFVEGLKELRLADVDVVNVGKADIAKISVPGKIRGEGL